MARLALTNLLCEPRLDVAVRTISRQRLSSWVTPTGVCTVCACRRAALVVSGNQNEGGTGRESEEHAHGKGKRHSRIEPRSSAVSRVSAFSVITFSGPDLEIVIE